MSGVYATVYSDKWRAIHSIKAISERERQRLAAAMLDYACMDIEPTGLTNVSMGLFEAIKTSLFTKRRGAPDGNQNARKDTIEKNNSKTISENNSKNNSQNNSKNELYKIHNTKYKIQNTENPPYPPSGDCAPASVSFEEFWEAYPKKRGKIDAQKAYERATRKKGPAFRQSLLEAVEKQKRSSQWLEDNGRFIPYPATWLNKGKWADELEPAENVPKPEPVKAPIETCCPGCKSEDMEQRGGVIICNKCGKSHTWNGYKKEWREDE